MAGQKDIHRIGATGDGRQSYYVKWAGGSLTGGRALRLVLIDEHGTVEPTPVFTAWHDAAMSEQDAVIYHLSRIGVIDAADADLERRRREQPAEDRPTPEPQDAATHRFLSDYEGEW